MKTDKQTARNADIMHTEYFLSSKIPIMSVLKIHFNLPPKCATKKNVLFKKLFTLIEHLIILIDSGLRHLKLYFVFIR